jgi:hypothetical protein
MKDNIIGSVMTVLCDEGYRLQNLTTDSINTTCIVNQSSTAVEWSWVPPCEGKAAANQPIGNKTASNKLVDNKTAGSKRAEKHNFNRNQLCIYYIQA